MGWFFCLEKKKTMKIQRNLHGCVGGVGGKIILRYLGFFVCKVLHEIFPKYRNLASGDSKVQQL